jgi:hypothetical protein
MNIAGSGSGSIGQRHGSAYSDTYQNVTDPQHRRKRNSKFRSASDTARQNDPRKKKEKKYKFHV